ncbi:hypothetical protein GUITHDRAFT_115727 [Guillardia theta CCMP2712]|uniref:Uncharacterized protein n=1 Tax=Guillardia theta (strain CCMP2712) TaxID=905079 RepID=L1IQ17_GUITC|nr:hypothetical protein GUITHDRAFT_115727 [Guillardia theta CCMP2712]EKX38182.1 hypothetical protein GUITHDRAFT_115727 [Guillardia theta CCMP2712]|eukprot:XP_005825162.1 hypothetical protein GUITHDRAFT_115727 [Guillardia theta CCMP2712]
MTCARSSPLVLFGLWLCVVNGERQLNCYDGPFASVLIHGCVDDCRSFETLQEAEHHCNRLPSCGGITKSAYGDHEAISLGVGLYEVRAGPAIGKAVGETSWIKQVNCQSSRLSRQEQSALSDINRMVRNHQLQPDAKTSDKVCYSYSVPIEGKYLNGCVDKCRSFHSLDSAQRYCNTLENCGGVTRSMYGEGQKWHQGDGAFEVRMGPALKTSKDGDLSWVKLKIPCEGNSMMGIDQPYREETSSAMLLVYLIGFAALLGTVVYVMYVRGNETAVMIVEKGRHNLRRLLDRKKGGKNSGYEAL